MDRSPVMNINELDYTDWGNGEAFQARLGLLSQQLGARKLGYRVVVLPAGKKAWPYHAHYVNEEMFFILDGTGTLRFEGKEFALKAGDVIACPAEPDKPHQIVNTSNKELKYLAVSTMEHPEVAHYPDSNKLGVMVGGAPGVAQTQRKYFLFPEKASGIDYWEGES